MDEMITARIDVTKGRSKEFVDVAKRLGDFIKGIPMDTYTNDKLVDLMVKQVEVAEFDAFEFGFSMAIKLMADEEEEEL